MNLKPSRPSGRVLRVAAAVIAVQVAAVVAGKYLSRRFDEGSADDAELRRIAVLNGVNLDLTSQSLRHARFDLGMGGVNLDLTEATLHPDGATIEVRGLMGGVNIEAPARWRVTTESRGHANGVNVDGAFEGTANTKFEPTALASDEAPDQPTTPHLRVIIDAQMSGVNLVPVGPPA